MDNGVLPFKQCGPIGVKPRQIPGMEWNRRVGGGAVQTRNIVAERHEMSSKFRSQMPPQLLSRESSCSLQDLTPMQVKTVGQFVPAASHQFDAVRRT
jgi:hypothetical protein